MDVVPDDLTELVHRAARATAPHVADLANVRRRARARRRRRAAATAAGLAVLVALTGGAVPLLAGDDRAAAPVSAPSPPPTGAGPTTPAPPPAPAQRLFIAGGGGSSKPLRGGPEIGLVGGAADEVVADGSVVRHRVPAGWESNVALPDGRLVGLKLTDLMPGVQRRDGPNVAGLSIKLMLLDTDGRIQRSREVRVKGQGLELVGADERYAYLVRDNVGLVAHELATGREETLIRASKVRAEVLFGTVDVAAGLVVTATSGPSMERCQVDVLRLADGRRQSRLEVKGDCAQSIRLSPNGRLVAIPYGRPSGRHQWEYRMAILDTTSGQRLADQFIGTASVVYGLVVSGTWGAAWADDTTVRVVWAQLPQPARKVYSVSELARVVTVSAQ
ncbi:hypothetical protein [Micromonospora inositola]|uniref:Uncharacterized protein n=1 Tax=Micromonospora inositola TaxID=47865 RepID=A0A1C5I7U7_9ACTN|nr:hypothetical protein [Micromonospora inositola]SCG54512.1 hypothetical protein GA0070613_2428 [Micromonospora inositola]